MGILKQMTRKVLSSLLACIISTVIFANPVVTDITAKQRFPWNGLVDITLTLSGTEEECKAATWEFYATNKATNVELPVVSVKKVGMVTGDGNQWIKRFVWNAVADVGNAKFGEVALTVGKPSMGVQLWEGGPYWAECNVGAAKPEECGYYFWWGDTEGYMRNAKDSSWVSVKDGSLFNFIRQNCPTDGMNDLELRSVGYIGAAGNLAEKYDAATAHLGAPWRMPTSAEFDEMISKCDTEWTMVNGAWGRLVKGRDAYSSKRIFFPAAGFADGTSLDAIGSNGYYWSSSPNSGDGCYARTLRFYLSDFVQADNAYRRTGRQVRPVRGFVQ